MTVEEELEVIERHMREKGLRWTAQRRVIAKVALETHDHFTADELLDMCREVDRNVSRATVYRTLSMLETANFVEALETPEGMRRFEHTIGHEHHDHMICTRCSKILEFRDEGIEQLQLEAARRAGFRMTSHSLKLFGVCAACLEGRAASEPARDGADRGA
jgi:Fur family ferric uptake transcriptional regulator